MGRGGADSNSDRGFSDATLMDMDADPSKMVGTSSNTWDPPQGWQDGDGAWKYRKMGDGKNVGFMYKYMYPGDGRRLVSYGRENAETPPLSQDPVKPKCRKGMGCNNSGGPTRGVGTQGLAQTRHSLATSSRWWTPPLRWTTLPASRAKCQVQVAHCPSTGVRTSMNVGTSHMRATGRNTRMKRMQPMPRSISSSLTPILRHTGA